MFAEICFCPKMLPFPVKKEKERQFLGWRDVVKMIGTLFVHGRRIMNEKEKIRRGKTVERATGKVRKIHHH